LQLRRTPADDEEMNIYEFKRIYKGELEQKKRPLGLKVRNNKK